MPDLKITVSRNFGPYQTETTTYLKPGRRRVEEQRRYRQQLWVGGPAVSLRPSRIAAIALRCRPDFPAQSRRPRICLETHPETPLPRGTGGATEKLKAEQEARAEQLKTRAAQAPNCGGPLGQKLIEITTNDTGERKQMFGYAARPRDYHGKKNSARRGGLAPPRAGFRLVVHRSRYFHFLRSTSAARVNRSACSLKAPRKS